MTPAGFSHSEISGSKPVCDSPELIAANYVLHRHLTPRHPSCALSSLTANLCEVRGPRENLLDGVATINYRDTPSQVPIREGSKPPHLAIPLRSVWRVRFKVEIEARQASLELRIL